MASFDQELLAWYLRHDRKRDVAQVIGDIQRAPKTNDRFVTGRWYPTSGALTTGAVAAMTQDTLRANRFFVAREQAFDRIGLTRGPDVAGASYRLGIYADTGNDAPGELVVDGGSIDVSTGGQGFGSVTIAVTLAPGLYWLAGVSQGGNPTMGQWGATAASWFHHLGGATSGTGPSSNVAFLYGHTQTGVTGTLPSSFGTPAGSILVAGPNPALHLRAA